MNSVRPYNDSDISKKYNFMKILNRSGECNSETPDFNRNVLPWTDYPDGCRLPVTLVCHTGKEDVSTFDRSSKNASELLKQCTEVQGGLVTLESIKINPMLLKVVKNSHLNRFPLSVTIADTMCHAPVGQKSLDALGGVVGFEKLLVSKFHKKNMGEFFAQKPLEYVKYSATDSLVTLLYYSSLWGYNQSCRVTLSSAAAFGARALQMDCLDCMTTHEYDRKYRGVAKVGNGLVKRSDGAGFLAASSLEAINNDARMVQIFCSEAYSGGYNACIDVGYYPFKTYDYDLSNAYPSAMCLVPDLDWERPIKTLVRHEELHLSDFVMPSGEINPVPFFVGDVSFEFPPDVKYPCITYRDCGVPVYLLKSEGDLVH